MTKTVGTKVSLKNILVFCVCSIHNIYVSIPGASPRRLISEARRVGVRRSNAADGGGLAVGARAQVAEVRVHSHRVREGTADHLTVTHCISLLITLTTKWIDWILILESSLTYALGYIPCICPFHAQFGKKLHFTCEYYVVYILCKYNFNN